MPTGKVLAVTDKNGGRFKVGNDWYGLNYAAKKAGVAFMPDKGDEVEFTLDERGYVDHLVPAGKGPTATTATSVAVTQATNVQAAGWIPPGNIKAQALNAAATILSGTDDTIEHLAQATLLLAQSFECWLLGQALPEPRHAVVMGNGQVLRPSAAVAALPDLPF